MALRFRFSDVLRILSADQVQNANSGHVGMPLGFADVLAVLWSKFYKHNPSQPNWFNRDRFVLSNGHGSAIWYALLHLTGYDLGIEDLKQFRQISSRTPGHPEYGATPGIESTSGPLGLGLAMAVGMAMAEKSLAATYNRPGHCVVDHRTFVCVGDGCLMEGVSHEAVAIASQFGLGKLVVLWDDNEVSIDGPTNHWFGEATYDRFRAYGFKVIESVDGHDEAAISQAIQLALSQDQKPVLIGFRTKIGWGMPSVEGTEKAHGHVDGTAYDQLRQTIKWPYAPFEVPETLRDQFCQKQAGQKYEQSWQQLWQSYQQAYPELATELNRRWNAQVPQNFDQVFADMIEQSSDLADQATRKSLHFCWQQLKPHYPELIGGSADLTDSTGTALPSMPLHEDSTGSLIHFGVREFGMYAVLNGLALHGGFVPFAGTFLVFSDYAKPALRLAAMMKLRVLWVLTHDSIGVGEDGPTHQPIEQLAMLRSIPNVQVWRPCDRYETIVALQQAIAYQGPSCFILSRQKLPQRSLLQPCHKQAKLGAWTFYEPTVSPSGIIIATGSEVALAHDVALALAQKGIGLRVVSMPCEAVFLQQSQAYQDQVLPKGPIRFAIEAASPVSWFRWVDDPNHIFAISQFGQSGPGSQVMASFGFHVSTIMQKIENMLTLRQSKDP